MSRSAYYRVNKPVEREEKELEKEIIHCFRKNHSRYGRIRIRKALLKKGIKVSEYKISRILRENGLAAKGGRPGKNKPKKPAEQQYIEGNLIRNKFSICQANYLWCSDITEIRCRGRKLYVCGIIDVATRRIVGWSIDKTQTQKLAQDAFLMAVGRNPNRPVGAIYHSDRGSQYIAKKTKELVEGYGFRKSMSRPGTPSDNQPIESFWRTLKTEIFDVKNLCYEDARRAIIEYIEIYYNSSRMHSGINYSIPNDFFTLLSVHNA